jgi:hypothetical protein
VREDELPIFVKSKLSFANAADRQGHTQARARTAPLREPKSELLSSRPSARYAPSAQAVATADSRVIRLVAPTTTAGRLTARVAL